MEKVDKNAGSVIKRLRKRAGLSQTELAKAVGITYQQLSKYESGVNRMSISRMFQFCDVLRLKPAEFIVLVQDMKL